MTLQPIPSEFPYIYEENLKGKVLLLKYICTINAAYNLNVGLSPRLPGGQPLVRILDVIVSRQPQEIALCAENGPERNESERQGPLCQPAAEVLVQRQVRYTVPLLLHL
jgi:hypothetical protein